MPGSVAPGRPMMLSVAQMLVAQHRCEAAGQRLVGEQRIEVHRRRRHRDALAAARDRRMEIGQGLGVGQPRRFGDEPVEQVEDAVGAIDEAFQPLAPVVVAAAARAAFVQPALGARRAVGRRQPR